MNVTTPGAREWHRWIGLVALVFLFLIAVTGILIHFAAWFPSAASVKTLYALHSGAFFGPVGRWVYDLVAIAVLGLGVTGLVLWVRGRRVERRLHIKETDLFGDEGVFTWIWEAGVEGTHQVARLVRQLEASGKRTLFDDLLVQGDVEIREGKVFLAAHVEDVTCAHLRRHRIAERVLADWWGQDVESLHPYAHQLEPLLDEAVERELCRGLGHPKRCPHGSHIPPAPCCRAAESPTMRPLPEAPEGRQVTYVFARAQAVFQRLLEWGVTPGTSIQWSPGDGGSFLVSCGGKAESLKIDPGTTVGILVTAL